MNYSTLFTCIVSLYSLTTASISVESSPEDSSPSLASISEAASSTSTATSFILLLQLVSCSMSSTEQPAYSSRSRHSRSSVSILYRKSNGKNSYGQSMLMEIGNDVPLVVTFDFMLSKVLVCRIAEGINQRPRLALWPDVFAPFDVPSFPRRLYSTSEIR